jgi:hypothetical protein
MRKSNVNHSLSPRVDVQADFCGELESYAVTGETTNELDRLCGKLWNCPDTLPSLACSDADLPKGSSYARAAQKIRRAMRAVESCRPGGSIASGGSIAY